MAIADTIQSMYENVGEVYDTITNVDLPTNKNIQNIPSTMRSSYLEIMNNGIDKIWNNWEKVTGEGETLTLNSTEEAPMKINLKGNTSQEGTPTPEAPQAIHVVSGDNSINVCGKNILKLPDNIRTFNGGVNVETSNNTKFTFTGTSSAAYYNSFALNYHLPKGTYTMSSTNNNFKYYFWFRDKSNVTTYANVHLNNSSRTFILEEDSETIIVGVEGLTSGTTYNIETYFQLEKGDSATSYEPFNSDTYNVDLPVENLFDTSLLPITKNGVTISKDDEGNVVLNGTPTITSGYIGFDFTLSSTYLKAGTYTSSIKNKIGGIGITINQTTPGGILNLTMSDAVNSKTGTLTTDLINGTIGVNVRYDVGTLTNFILNPQLEKGSKANSYTPFGTTPIELCKIGTYQDRIFKSSGKNLFDNTYNDLGMWITNIGETTTFAQGSQYLGAYCKVEPGTYTISRNKKTNRFRIGISPNQPTGTTSSCYVVASNDNASSITIDVPQGNNYICIYLSNNSETSTNVDLMINEGTTALPYEPYGKVWYLNKQIGKVVLNGSESWNYSSQGNVSRFDVVKANAMKGSATSNPILSTHFKSEFALTNGSIFLSGASNLISIMDNDFSNANDFKVWLSSNNVIVYYAFTTPTYTEITDSTLLEQLETFYNAKSKNSQTNITQENNDLPFILDATALKQLTQ